MREDLIKAIDHRVSRRSFEKKAISKEKLDLLQEMIDLFKEVDIRMVVNDGDSFKRIKKSYGYFTNVDSYIVLVSNNEDKTNYKKLGYYTEQLVLKATSLDIGTCWIGTNIDKTSEFDLKENEVIIAIIALGIVKEDLSNKEKIIHFSTHRSVRVIDSFMVESDVSLTEDIINGLKALAKAPSAINRQPVRLTYLNNVIHAYVEKENKNTCLDLGIGMLHFELGSGLQGHWDFENGNFIEEKV